MAPKKQESNSQQREASGRRERAHRILDAAAALILRWGYDKTNVEDIARQAGVGKGTIYLHWKTREELFRALIKREQLAMAADFKQRISEDPAGATLHTMYKHYVSVLMKRPLLKALILRDTDVLGKFAHSEHSSAAFIERVAGFKIYLEFLREHGLVRTDLSMREQVYMLSAIVMGSYLIAPWMPDELTLTDEELADLVADTVQRSLESGRSASADELQVISHTFLEQLNRGIALYEAQFQHDLDS
ncbi:MAG: TetR/AcrR family transcriptional regulator [Chloroflexi bacterium]|nr:TetR/AcrR family transcriptional regulator [Chloroflexota bacterium]